MSMHKLTGVAALLLVSGVASADGPNLGKRLSAQEIAAWDISILPDGGNLPPGSGNAEQGARAYAQKCVACHGESGKGGIAAALVGSAPITTISGAQKTIANFWPYPTTVFDFIRRAMPWQQPMTLTNDDASDKQGNDKLDWTRVARASSVASADRITSRIRIQRRAEPIELARSLTGLEA